MGGECGADIADNKGEQRRKGGTVDAKMRSGGIVPAWGGCGAVAPICWTHLPNSVNLVKARPPPDMGMLSKARQGPARRGLVSDWSRAACPALEPTNGRRELAGPACRRVTRPDKQIGVLDTARHAGQCPVIRLIRTVGALSVTTL